MPPVRLQVICLYPIKPLGIKIQRNLKKFNKKCRLQNTGHFMSQDVNSLRPGDVYTSVNYVIIASDNGLSPIRRQAIIWINAGLWSIGKKSVTLESKQIHFLSIKYIRKYRLQNVGILFDASKC